MAMEISMTSDGGQGVIEVGGGVAVEPWATKERKRGALVLSGCSTQEWYTDVLAITSTIDIKINI